jgi:hypothetical protein
MRCSNPVVRREANTIVLIVVQYIVPEASKHGR